MIQESIATLGHQATDRVSGFSGTVTSVSFDLYGCVQAVVSPPYNAEKETQAEGRWFDINRLVIGDNTAMPVPDFDSKGTVLAEYNHGAAEKPAFY